MKTSVSIPDELWRRVENEGDGPSAVVQKGLTLLADQIEGPGGDMPLAPSASVADQARDDFDRSLAAVVSQAEGLVGLGYQYGVRLASLLRAVDIGGEFASVPRWTQIFESASERSKEMGELDEDDMAETVGLSTKFWVAFDVGCTVLLNGSTKYQRDGVEVDFADDGWPLPQIVGEVEDHYTLLDKLPPLYCEGIARALVDVHGAALRALKHSPRQGADTPKREDLDEDTNTEEEDR